MAGERYFPRSAEQKEPTAEERFAKRLRAFQKTHGLPDLKPRTPLEWDQFERSAEGKAYRAEERELKERFYAKVVALLEDAEESPVPPAEFPEGSRVRDNSFGQGEGTVDRCYDGVRIWVDFDNGVKTWRYPRELDLKPSGEGA